jgi:glycosyltransferase involved in cell wall biosynthesis
VLASDIGGLPESVGNGGILFEPPDIDACDKGLKSIWNDEHFWWKFSEQARERSGRAELNSSIIAKEYEKALYSFVKNSDKN